jgi:cytochrome c553
MAKELKALIKKYNGKVIFVSKNTQEQKEFEAKQKLSKTISKGKKLYKDNCQECHGVDATKESYGTSRALTSLTRSQFKDALWGYSNDEYSRGMAMIMRPFADQLIDEDQDKIYEYIQTLK